MATPDPLPEPSASFDEFLRRMEPRLKRLLGTYRIPPEDAEDVLQQTLLALLYQWDRVRDPECWLMGTLKRHCLMYWRNSRRRIYSAVDSTVLVWSTFRPSKISTSGCSTRSIASGTMSYDLCE